MGPVHAKNRSFEILGAQWKGKSQGMVSIKATMEAKVVGNGASHGASFQSLNGFDSF